MTLRRRGSESREGSAYPIPLTSRLLVDCIVIDRLSLVGIVSRSRRWSRGRWSGIVSDGCGTASRAGLRVRLWVLCLVGRRDGGLRQRNGGLSQISQVAGLRLDLLHYGVGRRLAIRMFRTGLGVFGPQLIVVPPKRACPRLKVAPIGSFPKCSHVTILDMDPDPVPKADSSHIISSSACFCLHLSSPSTRQDAHAM